MEDRAQENLEELTIREAVELGATDGDLFCRFFFPSTFRQSSPEVGRKLFDALDNPNEREIAFECFRGFGKTTRVRGFVAKRVSYAISRTIVIVSKSQDHALRSVRWVRRQVERNTVWAQTFQLSPGDKWTDDELTIYHGVEECYITILAVGIRGQTRGVNIDDWRPDLIIVDDPCDEENTATPEQRTKTNNELFGSLQKSLAPPTEAPDAMMALLQTPFNDEDAIATCRKSGWNVITIGCFDEQGESVWPDRFPTEFLKEEKAKHARRGDMSLWMREMECRIVSDETAAFRSGWLQFYEPGEEPTSGLSIFAIDPASSEAKNADEQVLMVLRIWEGNVYVLDYTAERGQDPDALCESFFFLTARWKALHGAVEAIAYQRVLAWYLRKEMRKRMQYRVIKPIEGEKRKKRDRIIQTLRPVASNYAIFVRRDMSKLIEQFCAFPDVMHDDVLDALAIGVEYAEQLGGSMLDSQDDVLTFDETNYPELEFRGAP